MKYSQNYKKNAYLNLTSTLNKLRIIYSDKLHAWRKYTSTKIKKLIWKNTKPLQEKYLSLAFYVQYNNQMFPDIYR